jgi:iron complex transport system permease protein
MNKTMKALKPSYGMLYTGWGIFLACCLITIFRGDICWGEAWLCLQKRIGGMASSWNPLLDERLPRVIVLFCSGASLAVSGAVMQALFQNPLANPSILGISCGGCLAVIPVFLYSWNLEYPYAIPIFAVGGCLLTLLGVYTFVRFQGPIQMTSLILTGIAFSSLLLAVKGAAMYVLRDNWQLVQTMAEWEAGSTIDRNWYHVHMQMPLTIIGLGGCWLYRKELDILSLGEEEAINLGIDVGKVRWRLFLCVSLLTGGTLAAVGIIAFFGLLLPHLLRKIQGPESIKLIPLSLVWGGALLTLMDLTLRVFNIQMLAIGNLSAIMGGCVFLFILLYDRQEG